MKDRLKNTYMTEVIFIAILTLNYICIAFQFGGQAGVLLDVACFGGFMGLHLILFLWGSRKAVYEKILFTYWSLVAGAFALQICSLYGNFTRWTMDLMNKVLVVLYPLYASMDMGRVNGAGAGCLLSLPDGLLLILEVGAAVFFLCHYGRRQIRNLKNG